MLNLSIRILKVPSKTDDFYGDIKDDVEKWYDILNYGERRRKRPLPV